MNFKKIITLLLDFTVTLSLAACGSKGDGKGDKHDDNIAVKLAKATSENNKATQSIIEHYSGGKE